MNRPMGRFLRRSHVELTQSGIVWLVAGYLFVLIVTLTASFQRSAQWMLGHLWVLLPVALGSLMLGLVVRFGYRLWQRALLQRLGLPQWKARANRYRSYVREATIGLCIFVVLGAGYMSAMYSAARVSNRIVAQCTLEFTEQLDASGVGEESSLLAHSACDCLARIFFERNGLFRVALFNTHWLTKEDYTQVDQVDEAFCLNEALESAPFAYDGRRLPRPDGRSLRESHGPDL